MRFAGLVLPAAFGAFAVAAVAAASSAPALLRALPRSNAVADTSSARPFEHRRHEHLDCRECHGTGAAHRTMLVRTPRDCATCHHDARRGLSCANCHRPEALPEDRMVTPLRFAVAGSARLRPLRFGHGRHAQFDCAQCHTGPIVLTASRDCASCHARHEQPAADCSACHAGNARAEHSAAAHLTCGGAGCHAARATLRATARNTCLACHAEQQRHENGGECAACHKVPTAALLQAPERGGRP